MKSGEETLDLIRDTFVEEKDLVDRLWSESAEFRELCDAYGACENAYRHWSATTGSSGQRSVEYAELLEKLREDIRRVLDKNSH